jgi:hypothetical protein
MFAEDVGWVEMTRNELEVYGSGCDGLSRVVVRQCMVSFSKRRVGKGSAGNNGLVVAK